MTASDARSVARSADVRRTERWFLRRGIPHFIHHYSATRNVFTRAIPTLSLIFVVELLLALNVEWPWWANLMAALGGFAILLAAWAAVNAARRRPLFALPESVGLVEAAVFVLVPPALPLVFGGEVRQSVITLVANLMVLVLVYPVVSYGLLPMTSWAVGQLFRQFGLIFRLLARALPLLLLIVTLSFISDEVWSVAAPLDNLLLGAATLLLVGMSTLFVVIRIPREVAPLQSFRSDEEVAEMVSATPAASLLRTAGVLSDPPPLNAQQWFNVGLVMLFTQGVQGILVSLLMGAFLVVFGLLTIPPTLITQWTGRVPDVILTVDLLGHQVALTVELLRVAVFMAVFSGFYFTVYGLTDATYREEFLARITGELREAFAVRAVYLAAVRL